MSRPSKFFSSRRRSILSFQTLEDRRLLAATTPDAIELTSELGPNGYAGPFEQRTIVAPQYTLDAQGNRAIDLRIDLPGDQTVIQPSTGVNDDGPYGIEQSQRIARVMVSPNERYVIEHRYSEGGIPISAFNASGELIARLLLATDPSDTDDQGSDVVGRYLAYIGDINWSDVPALKLPPSTASIVFTQAEITSIGFLDDSVDGAAKTVTWGSEPLYISSKPVDLVEADDPIPINAAQRYRLSANVSTVGNTTAKQSVGYTAYDRDGQMIEPQHVTRYLFAVDTTLARELKPGDTTIELSDATGWSNLSSDPSTRALAWYGYRDASGNTYADYTYTRNIASNPGLGLWSAGAVVGNRITLRQPWNGPTLPSGIAVRNAVTGSSLFPVLGDDVTGTLSGAREITGFWRSGSQDYSSFPPATAIIRPAAELNQSLTFSGSSRLSYRYEVASSDVTVVQGSSFRDVTIDVLANDHELGSAPRITEVTTPKFGTVQIINDSTSNRQKIKYTSNEYFIGVVRFSYTVANESGAIFTEQVTISSLGSNLESIPALSQAIAQSAATTADEIRWVSNSSNVYNVMQGSELNVSGGSSPLLLEGLGSGSLPKFVLLERAPQHGSLKMEPNGAFRYFADANYSGTDWVGLRVSNGVRSRIEYVHVNIGSSAAEVDQGKLGQIGMALESGLSSFRQYFYPTDPTYYDANKKPFLSWRVHALPFLGYQSLYNQFRLNEPWNSPNNLPLAAQMPDVFRSWGEAGGNLTRFQTIQAGLTSSGHWIDVNGVPRSKQANATHGPGNSILVLQTNAANAVVWTKPEDLVFADPQSTLAKLTAPLFPAYFWSRSRSTLDTILVPQDLPASQFQSIATISDSNGVLGVDVASLARGWAERADTPVTGEEYGVSKANDNMRVLSIAFNNYESVYKYLPNSGTTSPTGQSLLSWRVQILPYLGLTELYNRFNQNEPWDSPNNIALLSEMPDVFRSALDLAASTTTRIRVVDGTNTPYDHTKTRVRYSDFYDGLSNTILFVEAGVEKAVPWTQPEAIPVDMSNIWQAFGSFPTGFMRIGMADGSVGKLGTSAPNAEIAALLTTGLRAPAQRADEELYDGLTLMERSGFPTPMSARVNLIYLAHAANIFNDTYRVLPPNSYGGIVTGTSTTALLSWRVSILPFLEADRLFQKFNLKEAWDSPNNVALMKYMPYFLRSVGDPASTANTRLQSFVGTNSFVNSANKKLRLNDLLKGPGNTLAYVQTGIDKAVPWTKPADVNAEAASIWKELGRVGQSARFTSVYQSYHLTRNQSSYLTDRTLSEAVNVNYNTPKTIIESNSLVIREGDFGKADLMMTGSGDVMEMDPQSFLTMTTRMTFAAAENSTVDGTRKVQVRWGKRSDPADPNSPLIVSQALDIYVVDDEALTLLTSPKIASESLDKLLFLVARDTAPGGFASPDLSSPLTVTITTDSPNRIQLPSSVVIPAGEWQVAFTGTTLDNSVIEGPVTVQVAVSAPGRLDGVAQISIADDDALRVTINPSSIREKEGSTTATVTRLIGTLDQPLTVNLSSSSSTIARVPTQVTIPAGSSSASFTIAAVSDDSFDGIQYALITAQVGQYQRSYGRLTVYDFQPLQLHLFSNSISESGTTMPLLVFRGEVPLDLPVVVQLQSSDTTELTVPATVTIPANESAVMFDATAVDDRLLDGTQTVTITASSNTQNASTVSINVYDHEAITLTFSAASISENGGVNVGRVTRSNTDTDQPLVVSLRTISSDPALLIPPSVIIPAGASFVDFEVRTVDDTLLNFLRPVYVEAENAEYQIGSAGFVITDDENIKLTIDRSELSEASEKTTARVWRSNTDVDQALPVTLAFDRSVFFVNDLSSVVIPAGSAYLDFTIETLDNHKLSGTRQYTISAESANYISSSVQVVVTDYEELTVQFDQRVVPENGLTVQAFLSRGDWDDVSQPLTVHLRTNTPGLVDIPSSVTIPANSMFTYFPVTTIDDEILSPAGRSVIVEAIHPSFASGSDELLISDFETLSVKIDETQVFENGQVHGRVIRSNTNVDEAVTFVLDATTPGVFRTPKTIKIPAGSVAADFTIDCVDDKKLDGSRLVQIVAESPDYHSIGSWIEVLDYEPLEFELSSLEQFEGTSLSTTVTRNVDDLSQESLVYVLISDRSQITGPAFITIPANQRSVTFELVLLRDHIRDGNKRIGIEVQSDGFVNADATINTLDLETLWHNPLSPLDVNDDGAVSPLDVLLVINFLNRARGPVAHLVRTGVSAQFLDTSNDGNLSPVDALLVLNHLNRRSNGEGEPSEARSNGRLFDDALWQLDELARRKRIHGN